MATISIRVYLKAQDVPHVLVQVAPEARKHLEALKHRFSHAPELRDRLRAAYGDGSKWRVLDADSQPLAEVSGMTTPAHACTHIHIRR